MKALVVIALASVLGFIASSNVVVFEPCTMLTIVAQNVCTIFENDTMDGCCDQWCSIKTCSNKVEYTVCTLTYMQVNKCCPGYSGSNCSQPVCDDCNGPNQICSGPNNCTCIDGWNGDDCDEVPGLQAAAIDSNSISLSWKVPLEFNNVNGYYVYVEKNNQIVYDTSIYDTINHTTIDNLDPFTSYKACVVPLVLEGNGTESCTDIQTKEDVPTSPPLNIAVEGFITPGVLVQWSPPTQPNGKIVMYKLYVNYTSGQSTMVTVDSQFIMYIIEKTHLGNVSVSISAVTSAGEGVKSQYVPEEQNKDSELKDVSPLTNIGMTILMPLSDTQILLSWTPPPLNDSNSKVAFYVLRVSSESNTSNSQHWALSRHQKLQHTLSLSSGNPYKIEVFCGTEMGNVGLLYNETFFVKEEVPFTYPDNITALRLSEDSIKIQWDSIPLDKAHGFVTKYTIKYSKGRDNSCIYSFNTNMITTVNSLIILNDVAINSVYCISVSVSTSAGNGPFSPSIIVPIHEYSSFDFFLSGTHSCEEWEGSHSCTSNRLTDVRQELIKVLNRNCSCITSDEYFFNETFTCMSSNGQDNLYYTANIVGIGSLNSSNLVGVIDSWVESEPNIVVQGMALTATSSNTNNTIIESCSDKSYTAYIVAIVILCVLLLISWAIVIIYCLCKCLPKPDGDYNQRQLGMKNPSSADVREKESTCII